MKYNFLVVILGPTSIGKTQVALFLAKKFRTQILSCDSRQFYKELKIGTGVPNEEVLNSIPHHFIGHLSIHDYYNAKFFEKDAINKLKTLFIQHYILIMVGGSSLYEKAVTVGLSKIPNINQNIRNELILNFRKHGISFLQHEITKYIKKIPNIDIQNPFRLIRYLEIIKSTRHTPSFFFNQQKVKRSFYTIKIGLILSKKEIHDKINHRVDNMIKLGLLDEAKSYYQYRHLNSLNTIGYKEIFNFLSQKTKGNIYNTIDEIKIHTRQYAKKQLTWYKKDSDITWFSPQEKNQIVSFILKQMGNTGFEPVTPCV
ncbi:tRNA (adenosine(37)-N6)-dimethylallyltransferase MiaA [Blattabacterium cuenoti]|uniref:tRNA (adenosine(37)-N6)-dimethylallyltransferase MiaA n=1 Tax=Blattabacterium cuenoti TaxID=1653831 RepID=UPI00163B6479|nr:tRNA (adenosine(37)-N6)-dimethylallyltransferase MiaA [Blattabacterium cuenoti]